MIDFTVVIPARFASSRLPGKPLVDINGQTMIERVYRQALKSAASQVVVATDDTRIVDACQKFGAKACLTSKNHLSGTDRIYEVCQHLSLDSEHIVVNVQGDEPLIPPEVINQVAKNLHGHIHASCATLSTTIHSEDEFKDPNAVKVVSNQKGLALYFSRAPIPWPRATAGQWSELIAQRHIGIYAYRVSTLAQFVNLPPSTIEQLESLEQLRLLDNGLSIHVEPACEKVPLGIDTEHDLERIRKSLTE